MSDGVHEVVCPCCGAAMEIDAATGVVLAHEEPKRPKTPVDLGAAVKELKLKEKGRDELFAKQFAAERKHEEQLGQRFEGLLKKARTEPPGKPRLRDIDLD